MSVPLTGPLADFGQSAQTGVAAYFQAINYQGGINNRELTLVVRDDAYHPLQAAENTRRLIKEDEVIALIGNVGTPTTAVAAPVAEKHQTLLFAPITGGDIGRGQPSNPYLMYLRPGYRMESKAIVNGLLAAGYDPTDMAFFTQRDSYGDSVYETALDTLSTTGFAAGDGLVHGRYERDTMNVEAAAAEILASKQPPRVIITAGTDAPTAKYIRLVSEQHPNILFVSVSFVGSHLLADLLKSVPAKVLVSQVVPHPDEDLPLTRDYRQAMQTYDASAELNPVSLEAFLAARVFHQGLMKTADLDHRDSVSQSFRHLETVDVGLSAPLKFDKDSASFISRTWLTRLQKGQVIVADWDEINVE